MATSQQTDLMLAAIGMARDSIGAGGGPFGCVIVKDGQIVGKGHNQVTLNNDPTAHAEVVAIRDACTKLGTYQLTGCDVYCSCEPCPMCLGALYWARPQQIFFASSRDDAAAAGFDDAHIYREFSEDLQSRKLHIEHIPMEEAEEIFRIWINNEKKTHY
jgi:tRNA(Arg) A34 adenosine deaminase TadA